MPTPTNSASSTHPFQIFSDMVDHHLWNKKALDMVESHTLQGKPGQDRFCERCRIELPPGWRNTSLPVPPSCEEVMAQRYKASDTRWSQKGFSKELSEKSPAP